MVVFSYSRASNISLLVQAAALLVLLGRPAVARLWLPWAVASYLTSGGWQGITWLHTTPAAAPPLANAPTTQPTLLHELGSVSDFSAANASRTPRA